MKEIIHSKYSPFFLAALVLNILAAWFSLGFFHIDEHFQVLEFTSYKLGSTTPVQLPWEFSSQIRASLLPDLAYTVCKLLNSVGLYNPFTVAFLLRLFTGLAAWFISCRMCLLLVNDMKTETGKKLLVLISLFMWFMPMLNVRFSSENVSAICFLYGLYPVLKSVKENKTGYLPYIIAGFLFGFASYIRIQTLISIGGLGLWMILINRTSWKKLCALAAAFIIPLILNFLMDWWYYGQVVFTPYGYFYSNIILHKAADFGVSPWWFYFSEFFFKAIPPLSILMLIMFFTGTAKNVKNPVVWIVLSVIVVQSAIAHKELRFMFIITFLFLYVAALGLDYLLTNKTYIKVHKYVIVISAIIIIPLLGYSVFIPAETEISYLRFLYNSVSPGNNTVFVKENGYVNDIIGTHQTFYNSPLMNRIFINAPEEMGPYMQSHNVNSAFYIDKKSEAPLSVNGFTVKKAYCFFPSWIRRFDINQWEERSNIWTIYRISREK